MTKSVAKDLSKGVGKSVGAFDGEFDFASVGTLAVDLDPAGQGVALSGSDVTDWDSEVGSVSFATSGNRPSHTDAYAPFNGLPAILFDAANSESLLYDAADMSIANYVLFAILDMQSTANQYLSDANNGGSGRLIITPATANIPANPGVGYYYGSWVGAGGQGATGTQQLTWKMQDGSNGAVRRDGSDLATGLAYTQRALFGDTGGACRLGASNGGGTYLDAYVGRILAYQGTLTADEISSVESALTAKYL